MARRIEPYDEENDEIAQEKKKIKARMAAEAAEEAKKAALAPPAPATGGGGLPHPGSAQLEALMTCCICMDRFRVPKMLPCQHSFCGHCLEGLYDWVKRQIKCPECRTEHHCSNPENYPTNLTMVRFMEVHIEAMGGDPGEAMQAPPVLQRCTVCGDNAELKNCAHCDRKVCNDCRDGHAEILKRELGRLINQVKRGVSRLEEAAGYIKRNEAQLTTNASAIREEIKDMVARYIKEIRNREELLLSQVNNFLQTEQRSMQHMQDNLDEEAKSLNVAMEAANKLLEDPASTVEDFMAESATFKDKFQKSLDFLKNFSPDAQEFTKSLRFIKGQSEPDLLHQCILAFGELHVNTMHFNRFVTNSERMATQLIQSQFEATLAEYKRQQQEQAETAAQQQQLQQQQPVNQPAIQLPQFQSEYMTRRAGEDLREYRDRRLESSPSRYNTTALEFPTRNEYIRESSAPASYLARVNRLTTATDPSSTTGTDPVFTPRSTTTTTPTTAVENPAARRQKYKDSRSHTADLGLLRESVDESGRRGSGGDTDNEIADALAGRGRYGTRRLETQDSTESVSGDGRRRYRGGAKTSELTDFDTSATRLYQRDTTTPDTASARSGRGGSSACEVAIARRRRRFGSTTAGSQDDSTPAVVAPTTTSARSPYSSVASAASALRETSPVNNRRARTPLLNNDSDEEDRAEKMPYYTRYLANKAKSREQSPTDEYGGGASSGRDLGATRDSVYLRKGRNPTKVGARGTEPGQLNWPRGVAVTPESRIAVADSSNHRVSIFDMSGTFVKAFGTYGSAPGEFDCLAGIAVAPDGRIVVSDRYNHRVSIHDAAGRFIHSFGSEGHLENQFQYPYGLCIGGGYIYVCDKDNARVQKFTLDGRFVGKFGSAGVRASSLNNPHYCALSATGDRIFISDSGNNRIVVYDVRDNSQVATIASEGTTDGKLQYPRGLAVDENDYIFVGDAGNNRVQIFGNRDYRFVSSFGSWGTVLGEFKGLEGVAVSPDGHILVVDRDNHRIQIF
ncbi:LOW QUALITY PROTEIN: RING finger protein nhl-1-like [Paramacrobiotus metropolitanus]|uniref:LOW QUALITY PROTEIN: RING finger protein nhl-1-like n=1 Tax=Paramacrobiotus metropolitanus TaxID=2943436 RepID=UPI0024464117|nr:LOW QUALITY PROTEIN: RING finger protein nhl-1-like [Paramacrobiotus metropolitanus]